MGHCFPCFANEEAKSEKDFSFPKVIHTFYDRARERNRIFPYFMFCLVHWATKNFQVQIYDREGKLCHCWTIQMYSHCLSFQSKNACRTDWFICICRQMLQRFLIFVWNVERIPYLNFHRISAWEKGSGTVEWIVMKTLKQLVFDVQNCHVRYSSLDKRKFLLWSFLEVR